MKSDSPIRHAEEDLLDRVPFALRISSELTKVDASEGVVAAICGSWGSGKTSIINLIRESLSLEGVIVDFNPWLFSDVDQLVGRLFDEISAQFKGSRKSKRLAKLLEQYAAMVAPLNSVPSVGVWSQFTGSLASLWSRSLGRRSGTTGTVFERRGAIEGLLSELEAPIYVIVDDLDRLQPDEVLEVLRLVRLTAHFPQIIFLLAFDWGKVVRALGQPSVDGNDYLEKIVDLRFYVPPMREAALSVIFQQGIVDVLRQRPDWRLDPDRWVDIFALAVSPLFSTLRSIKRFTANLRVALELVGDEVDTTDLIALEAWRTMAPKVHGDLLYVGKYLTETSATQAAVEAQRTNVNIFIEESERLGEPLRHFCRLVFPATARVFGGEHYGPDSIPEWRRTRRVACTEVLEIYLTTRVAPGTVASSLLGEAIAVFGDEEALSAIFNALSDKALVDLLVRLETSEATIPEDSVESSCAAILSQYDRVRPRNATRHRQEIPMAINRLVIRLLRQVASGNRIAEIAANLLNRDLSLLAQLSLANAIRTTLQGDEDGLVDLAQAVSLYRLVCRRIRRATEASLIEEGELWWLLLHAVEDDQSDRGQLDQSLESSEFLGALLRASETLPSKSLSASAVAEETPVLEWEPLLLIVGGQQRLKGLLDNLDKYGGSSDDKQAASIELARRYLEGYRPEAVHLPLIVPTTAQAGIRDQFVFYNTGDMPELIVRASAGFDIDVAITSRWHFNNQDHQRFAQAVEGNASVAVATAILEQRGIAATVETWGSDGQRLPSENLVSLVLSARSQDDGQLVFQSWSSVSLRNSGMSLVRVVVDLIFWPSRFRPHDGSQLGKIWNTLAIPEVANLVVGGLKDVVSTLPRSMLSEAVGGEPHLSIAEFHIAGASSLGQLTGSEADLDAFVDLTPLGPKSGPTLRDGMFAVTGETRLKSDQDRKIVVRAGLQDIAQRAGYAHAGSGLQAILAI